MKTIAGKKGNSGLDSAHTHVLTPVVGAGLLAWLCIFLLLTALPGSTWAQPNGWNQPPPSIHEPGEPADANGRATVMVSDLLFFGRSTPNGEVTAAQWKAFLAKAVTPRFPEGLTTWDADGQWRSSGGVIIRERSKVVQLIHPDDAEHEKAVREIIARYKQLFKQEAVMRVRSTVRVSF